MENLTTFLGKHLLQSNFVLTLQAENSLNITLSPELFKEFYKIFQDSYL